MMEPPRGTGLYPIILGWASGAYCFMVGALMDSGWGPKWFGQLLMLSILSLLAVGWFAVFVNGPRKSRSYRSYLERYHPHLHLWGEHFLYSLLVFAHVAALCWAFFGATGLTMDSSGNDWGDRHGW